jgi:hypothetical protein
MSKATCLPFPRPLARRIHCQAAWGLPRPEAWLCLPLLHLRPRSHKTLRATLGAREKVPTLVTLPQTRLCNGWFPLVSKLRTSLAPCTPQNLITGHNCAFPFTLGKVTGPRVATSLHMVSPLMLQKKHPSSTTCALKHNTTGPLRPQPWGPPQWAPPEAMAGHNCIGFPVLPSLPLMLGLV